LIVYLALEFFFAKFLFSPSLEAKAREDAGAFFIAVFLWLIVQSIVYSQPSPQDLIHKLEDLKTTSKIIAINLINGLFFIDLISSASVKLGMSFIGVYLSQWFAPYEGMAMVSEAISRAFQLFYSVFVNLQVLAFLEVDALNVSREVLFPLAMILYVFRPTREQGATLLALIFSFIVFFPFLLDIALSNMPSILPPQAFNLEDDTTILSVLKLMVDNYQMKFCRSTVGTGGSLLGLNLLLGFTALMGTLFRHLVSIFDTISPGISFVIELAFSMTSLLISMDAARILFISESQIKSFLMHFFTLYKTLAIYPATAVWIIAYMTNAISILPIFSIASNLKTALTGSPAMLGVGKIL